MSPLGVSQAKLVSKKRSIIFFWKLITFKILLVRQILKTDLGAGGWLKCIYLKVIYDIKDIFINIQQGHIVTIIFNENGNVYRRIYNGRSFQII